MKRRNVRTLSLIVVTFTYLLVGAAVFDALEGPHNEESLKALQHTRRQFVQKYNMTEVDYKILELLIIEKKPHKSGPQWKFAGSFYYALVVLTLIGYGHSTPATTLGKAFTMAYAMAGIPMAMVMFQSMGERMNKFYSVAIKRIRTWSGQQHVEATEFDLIVASGITSSIVVWCGALLYHTQEGWSFFDSFYYTFITLSTIGFGDFVALQGQQASLQFRPGYVVCSFIFLLLGLAALSSSINLLVLRFMILSLEEEEDEDAADAARTAGEVAALESELLAASANGRAVLLPGQSLAATSERNLCAAANAEQDRTSVCSCTCYGSRSATRSRRQEQMQSQGMATGESGGGSIGGGGRSGGSRILWCVGKMFGCRESITHFDEENFYDTETQSISNFNRFAVKRASF